MDLYNGFSQIIVTGKVGPVGNSDGLLGASMNPGKEEPYNDFNSSYFHRWV
jgi:hypothetical protein